MNRINTGNRKQNTKDVLEPFFRFWKRSIVFFLAVVLTTLAILAFTPSESTSTAKLIVRRSRENGFLDPLAQSSESRSVHKTWASEVKSELEILGNRELIQAVIQNIGAEAFLDTPEPKSTGKH